MYKRKESIASLNVTKGACRVDNVVTVNQDGENVYTPVHKEFGVNAPTMDDVHDVFDLQTQLKAGVLPREVNSILIPSTGEGATAFADRAHGALLDFISASERKIAEEAEKLVENPPTSESHEEN